MTFVRVIPSTENDMRIPALLNTDCIGMAMQISDHEGNTRFTLLTATD